MPEHVKMFSTIGKEKLWNSLKEGAMWHVDTLLDNDLEISNYVTAPQTSMFFTATRYNSNNERGVLYAVRVDL
jgi:hypothetical protein